MNSTNLMNHNYLSPKTKSFGGLGGLFYIGLTRTRARACARKSVNTQLIPLIPHAPANLLKHNGLDLFAVTPLIFARCASDRGTLSGRAVRERRPAECLSPSLRQAARPVGGSW